MSQQTRLGNDLPQTRPGKQNEKAPSIMIPMFKLPVILYQLRLGWLLAKRFLQITHVGRRSGKIRRTVLAVLRFDEETKEVYSVSAWNQLSNSERTLTMQFKKNTDVYTPDNQQVGRIDRVVIDPRTTEVTHIVIRKGLLFTEDKVVPLDLIIEATEDRVTLDQNLPFFSPFTLTNQHFLRESMDLR